jgi:hypothetical protein
MGRWRTFEGEHKRTTIRPFCSASVLYIPFDWNLLGSCSTAALVCAHRLPLALIWPLPRSPQVGSHKSRRRPSAPPSRHLHLSTAHIPSHRHW